ncbi:hypothetical protein E2C01_022111 [Portunus trituberculatus]|uniref:Uncharacterized protein n=1 Tax=Portunus trituberculatus TaxID=210409 RepID=A0A5B7E555_PORTR|nr:hypothetical protein [Portunus trituberculatus]
MNFGGDMGSNMGTTINKIACATNGRKMNSASHTLFNDGIDLKWVSNPCKLSRSDCLHKPRGAINVKVTLVIYIGNHIRVGCQADLHHHLPGSARGQSPGMAGRGGWKGMSSSQGKGRRESGGRCLSMLDGHDTPSGVA